MRRKIRPFQKAYALLQLEKRKYTIREIAKMCSEAIQLKIEHETFDHFKERVLSCFQSIDSSFIDKTIASLPKRIDYIIRLKGGRTKY